MALSSYFLVTAQHGMPEIRRAGFLYLLIAHVGAIAILLCFGVMQGGSWQFTFDAMRAAQLDSRWATAAFAAGPGRIRRQGRPAAAARLAARSAPGRAVAGFGVDERRHAEDSRLRRAAGHVRPARGPALVVGPHPVALGLATALFGVVFAAAQTDMKRLLAYSSIENIGVLFTGIGLAIVFHGVGMQRAGRAGADRGALPRAQPRVHEEPAVLRDRRGAARDRRAQSRPARRADPPHAVGCVAHARGRAGDRRVAAAERVRVRVAAAAGVPVRARGAAPVREHAAAARRGDRRPGRRAGRVRDGEVLRRRLPRPAARAVAGQRARRRSAREGGTRVARRGLRAARPAARAGRRRPRLRHEAAHWARGGRRRRAGRGCSRRCPIARCPTRRSCCCS